MTGRALITGVTGQDGSYLAEFLLEKGYEVHGMVRRSSTETFERIAHLEDKIHLQQADLLDQFSLVSLLRDVRPSEVYNLAAHHTVHLVSLFAGAHLPRRYRFVVYRVPAVPTRARGLSAGYAADLRGAAARFGRADPRHHALDIPALAERDSGLFGGPTTHASPAASNRGLPPQRGAAVLYPHGGFLLDRRFFH